MALNSVNIMGRLGADPDLRFTPSGTAVATANVAVDRDVKNKDGFRETDWFTVVAWSGTAKFLAEYFHKGDKIVVTGRLQARTYTTQDGSKRNVVEVVARDVYFADSKGKRAEQGDQAVAPQEWVGGTLADEDLPF